MNLIKTFFLMGILTALFMVIGYGMGGQNGMLFALGLAVLTNVGSYWFSDKLVLAQYRAHEVTREQAPQIYGIVQKLTQKADMPMPRVYVVPDQSPNAFATGRNPRHAVVAVTQGLLDNMNQSELEGVIAHELSHVKNRHILIGTIAATMASAIMTLAYFARFGALFGGGNNNRNGGNGIGVIFLLLGAIVAPIAAALIQMAISRSDEYDADATGAKMMGNPKGLASALGKLDMLSKRIPMQKATDATAHMFIVNPLTAGQAFRSLFSTHPPIAKRIERLTGSKYAGPGSFGDDDYADSRNVRRSPADFNQSRYEGSQLPPSVTRSGTSQDQARGDWDRLR